MNPLRRPDKVQSRAAFHDYVEAMARSLDQAVANPVIPYGPAVDDEGHEWENTTLATFLESMDAWIISTGWTMQDRRQCLVWTALSVPFGEFSGGTDDLRRYLADLRDWAADPALAEDQRWGPATLALSAGQGYE